VEQTDSAKRNNFMGSASCLDEALHSQCFFLFTVNTIPLYPVIRTSTNPWPLVKIWHNSVSHWSDSVSYVLHILYNLFTYLCNRALDLQSVGREFESCLSAIECNSGQVLNTRASVTMQYNLVPTNGRWCLAAGNVTIGLVRRTGHASQTLVVLHLWAQGLGEGDEHPPMLSYWSMMNLSVLCV